MHYSSNRSTHWSQKRSSRIRSRRTTRHVVTERGNTDGWSKISQPNNNSKAKQIEPEPEVEATIEFKSLQEFEDEFDIETPASLAEIDCMMNEACRGDLLTGEQRSDYYKRAGILLRMIKWSRHLKDSAKKHQKEMIRVMKDCVEKIEKPRRSKRRWRRKKKDPSHRSANG